MKTRSNSMWWLFTSFGLLPLCSSLFYPIWGLFGIGIALGEPRPTMETYWAALPIIGNAIMILVQLVAIIQITIALKNAEA